MQRLNEVAPGTASTFICHNSGDDASGKKKKGRKKETRESISTRILSMRSGTSITSENTKKSLKPSREPKNSIATPGQMRLTPATRHNTRDRALVWRANGAPRAVTTELRAGYAVYIAASSACSSVFVYLFITFVNIEID